jgi:AraC-like DNA-binding protein
MSSHLELRTLYLRPDTAVTHAAVKAMNVTGLLHEAVLRVCEQQYLDDRIEADRCLRGVILHELTRAPEGKYGLPMPRDDRARRAAEKMLTMEGSLTAIFDASGLTRRTAERVFARETGLSPAQWFRMARLTQSVIGLAEGTPIDTVSLAAGYQSRSAFSQAFKAVFGFSPGRSR